MNLFSAQWIGIQGAENEEIFFILGMKNRSYFLYLCFFCISFGHCYVKAQLTAHSSPLKKGRTAIGRLLR